MCAPSPPEPPDPKETSAAATGTSVSTAIANAMLGNVNRVGPDGSTTREVTGNYNFTDPYTNTNYDVPTFTETVTLSPQQQATYDQTKGAEFNLASLANNQSGFLKDYLNTPVDLSNEATEGRLFELGRQRMDPVWGQRRDGLETKLANQGIMPGSEAYNRAITTLSQQENDSYNSLLLQGRGQAMQEALTERNQPINEILGLLRGSEVSQPQFSNQPMPQIPTTDNAGLINTNYNQQLQNWQTQANSRNGILGGLFSFGAGLLSDRRAKTDIRRIGTADNGLPIYAYRYVFGGPVMVGFMADEVERVNPAAVHTDPVTGLKSVDYAEAA